MHAGIDTVGIYIENPNTILPMASYCRSIHQDVLLSGHEWAAADGKVRGKWNFHIATPQIWTQTILNDSISTCLPERNFSRH